MQPPDELVDGVVYLVADQYPDGPDLAISGEKVAQDRNSEDYSFHETLLIGGGGSIERIDHGYMVSLEGHISRAKLSSIAAAAQFGRPEAWPDRVYVHKGDGPINEYLLDLDERTYLEVGSSGMLACVEERYSARPDSPRHEYQQMVDSVCRNYECHVVNVEYFDISGTPIDDLKREPWTDMGEEEDFDITADMVHVVEIQIASDDEHAKAGQLISCGRAIHDYLAAIRGGELNAQGIVNILRGGHMGVLIGLQESEHLEIKSGHYNINANGKIGERQKIELAQDVARFANGNVDAVLVLGYAEDKAAGDSRVGRLSPLELTQVDTRQYQAVLDSKIVPSISGLAIEKVAVGPDVDSGIAFIFVPRQPEEMQPYLVQGAIVADKTEGAFFSIVQRRGEASITVSASQIHGYIVAGKAFLRRNTE